jgi:RimJ/RimL family protein N-acetyltransferase
VSPPELSFSGPVRTERLVLRPLVANDADALYAYRSLPEVARYVPFTPMTRGEVTERLAGRWAAREITGEGEGVLVGIERADTGELVGDVSLWLSSAEHRCAELGWLLHPAHGGQGFATEAAHGVLHLAFGGLAVHRVVARVDARNGPSLALCERLGMRREAVLVENEWFKGEWTDEVDYALLERDWAGQHPDGPRSCRWPLTPA